MQWLVLKRTLLRALEYSHFFFSLHLEDKRADKSKIKTEGVISKNSNGLYGIMKAKGSYSRKCHTVAWHTYNTFEERKNKKHYISILNCTNKNKYIKHHWSFIHGSWSCNSSSLRKTTWDSSEKFSLLHFTFHLIYD